jgi:hypothetical protein
MKRILVQLDTDLLPSTFDRVVAIDAGADEIFSYGGVTPENVEPLVHGAMFTRKPADLKHTAIFVGGGSVAAGQAVLKKVLSAFFGPVRVSVMMDSNGSNTTAAATVLAASRHLDVSRATALVLGGTGPVGCRAASILAGLGAHVRLASRKLSKAEDMCRELARASDPARFTPVGWPADEPTTICDGVDLLISSGAAGVELMAAEMWRSIPTLKVAVDLNAVPPVGLAGIEIMDKAVERGGVICYGAIGVGGTKMKIHVAALQRLFEANDLVLDTAAIYDIGKTIG